MYANSSPLKAWIDKETAGIVGICEANSYEKMCLWREYHEDRKISWEPGTGGGPMITIGMSKDERPTVLCLCVDIVDGKRVLFFDATSQLVDHKLIDEYVANTWPNVRRTDAMNFSNILR
jgi:hypothetical protein